MLHAELHGKLREDAPEAERREDILTSTVFGTLLLAEGGREILADWIRSVTPAQSGQAALVIPDDTPVNYWFWPSLRDEAGQRVEPDVILRLGPQLVVVEAKYAAQKGKATGHVSSSLRDGSEGGVTEDQLLREWRALELTVHTPHATDLSDALSLPQRHLVYLVHGRHKAKSLSELIVSYNAIRTSTRSTPSLWLLTWQDLHRLLVGWQGRTGAAPWVHELARLLERRYLAAFLGFSDAAAVSPERVRPIANWTASWRRETFPALGELFKRFASPRFQFGVQAVATWRVQSRHSVNGMLPDIRQWDWSAIHHFAMFMWRPSSP